MLIDFTVENYRSLKDSMTLSAVAQSGRSVEQGEKSSGRAYIKPDKEITPGYAIKGRIFAVLPVLGIFGANASGKSNVLLALDKLLDLMAKGNAGLPASSRTVLESISPFGLTETTAASPTRFRLRVAVNDVIYTYSLALDRRRIIDERLEQMRPGSKRNSLLFGRNWEERTGRYVWKNGEALGVYGRLQESIKEEETFLGLLTTHLNVDVLQEFTRWTKFRWQGLGHEAFDRRVSVLQQTRMGPEWKKRVVQFVRHFDTGLSDIEVETKQIGDSQEKLIAVHTQGSVSVRWPFEEESTGTQRLFDLANKVLSCLDSGTLILEDELGSNIHPHISREIVRLFQSPKTNPKQGQLIFTSHDNTLQHRNLLRRDQIWFTQKQPEGSTELYPLTDFKPRTDLAIDKAYLDGRFGAVPILPDMENFFLDTETVEDEGRELVA